MQFLSVFIRVHPCLTRFQLHGSGLEAAAVGGGDTRRARISFQILNVIGSGSFQQRQVLTYGMVCRGKAFNRRLQLRMPFQGSPVHERFFA
jgi:hypothetical protein